MDYGRHVIDYVEDRYGDGECGIFSQALNGMTNQPIVLFRVDGDRYGPTFPNAFPRHAAVRIGDDVYLDGFGTSNLAETSERFGMRLRVDLSPSLAAYPFCSGPGQKYFDQEEFSVAETHALSLLFARKLDGLVSDEDLARIVAADDRDVLVEFPAIIIRLRIGSPPLTHGLGTP
jgi:hypothetical protein